MLHSAIACLSWLLPSISAQPAALAQGDGPLPQWIWLTEQAGADERVTFVHDFPVKAGLTSAVLEGSCDNTLELYLNGRQVAVSSEWQISLKLDVADRLLAEEENRVSLQGWNESGPGGAWLRLRLEYEDGTIDWIGTDDTWYAKGDAGAGWSSRDLSIEGWGHAVELGELGVAPWALPLGTTDGKPPHALEASEVEVPEGFEAELVYNVPRTAQGSWVSLTTAPGGTLIASDQYGGLYRITPSPLGAGEAGTEVERIDVEIGEAQGLLWAFDSLYVVGGTSGSGEAGLYRVSDSDGDGELDQTVLLRALDGWGEHGPHAVVLSPDGTSLYVIAGNHTTLTDTSWSRVPRVWGEDQLLPRLPDPRGHAVGVMAPGGWVCRTDPEGREWELIASGMRNSYDMAFDSEGELFTYDSDMEWDVGLPWYRPTRVLHLVSGADFGWRHGSGKWPESYPDSWPGVVDIGLGSPTGVTFAPSAWGEAWRRTLLVADWAYGQIFAVDLKPEGASYTGSSRLMISGKPLPVTDLVVAGDVLYFTTGGRRVQSGLYRVRFLGEPAARAHSPEATESTQQLSAQRRQLERGHEAGASIALDELWPALASADPFVRRAARVALEHQPLERWSERALAEEEPRVALQAWLALARCAQLEDGDRTLAAELFSRWILLPFAEFTTAEKINALRLFGVISARQGPPSEAAREFLVQLLGASFPSGEDELDRELCRVLVALDAPFVVGRALELLDSSEEPVDRIFYFYALRGARAGWTVELREDYFRALQLAIRDFTGGASLTQYLKVIRDEAAESLEPRDRAAISPYLIDLERPATPPSRLRSFVQAWTVDELAGESFAAADRDLARGKRLLDEATCLSCHRFGGAGGNTGPDFSGAGSRFGVRDVLDAVLTPSAQISDQYQDSELITSEGELYVGRLEGEEGGLVLLRTLPPANELWEFPEAEVAEVRPHPLSRMPKGLLDTFERDEVLDLIAALLAGTQD